MKGGLYYVTFRNPITGATKSFLIWASSKKEAMVYPEGLVKGLEFVNCRDCSKADYGILRTDEKDGQMEN